MYVDIKLIQLDEKTKTKAKNTPINTLFLRIVLKKGLLQNNETKKCVSLQRFRKNNNFNN